MIESENLVVGKCYFHLSYYDHKLFMPHIITLIYIGRNIENEESNKEIWYFQDPESYLEKGVVKEKPWSSECKVHRMIDKESLFSIYDWNDLVHELSENKRAQDNNEVFNGVA